MERADTEMTEAAAASNSSHNDAAGDLLTLARQLVNQGKPSQALQAVISPTFSCFQAVDALFFFLFLVSFSFWNTIKTGLFFPICEKGKKEITINILLAFIRFWLLSL